MDFMLRNLLFATMNIYKILHELSHNTMIYETSTTMCYEVSFWLAERHFLEKSYIKQITLFDKCHILFTNDQNHSQKTSYFNRKFGITKKSRFYVSRSFYMT